MNPLEHKRRQAMAEQGIDPDVPPGLHLVSAFLAMEPGDCLLSLARACGGGRVTETVQRLVRDHCLSKAAGSGNASSVKNFLKKLIAEVESTSGDVLDELYEYYASCLISLKDDDFAKENARICKCLSFLFPSGCVEHIFSASSRKLMVSLQCSRNMLEGDTGCAIWPSSLFLSEFILSFPDIFFGKSCFEVGSGVGLVGICLTHVKASKVILSDGDLSTLASMKLNLEKNQLNTETGLTDSSTKCPSVVKCIHLPWESVSESDLQSYVPDIVLGADVIYDPSCIPHLVRVLSILLNQRKVSTMPEGGFRSCMPDIKSTAAEVNCTNQKEVLHVNEIEGSDHYANDYGQPMDGCGVKENHHGTTNGGSRSGPVAYIATVVRNIETFNCFLQLADKADLNITDLTNIMKPLDLLPYMQTYDRSSIRLFCVSCQ